MARIRTIKPEFWTSSQVAECTRDARLLFIGMWNFCDDAGRHVANTKRLKMEVFPGDNLGDAEVTQLVTQLVRTGLIEEYAVDGVPYWQVTGWKHQKIDKPNVKHPDRNGELIGEIPRRLGGKQRQLAYRKLCELHGQKCSNCGNPHHLAVDHKIPLNRGGSNEIDNLQLLCKTCNSEKRDKLKWGGGLTPESQVRGDALVTQGDALVTHPRNGGESIKTPPCSPPHSRPDQPFGGLAGLTLELLEDPPRLTAWLMDRHPTPPLSDVPDWDAIATAIAVCADDAVTDKLAEFHRRMRAGIKPPRDLKETAFQLFRDVERDRRAANAAAKAANGKPKSPRRERTQQQRE